MNAFRTTVTSLRIFFAELVEALARFACVIGFLVVAIIVIGIAAGEALIPNRPVGKIPRAG